MSAIETQGLEQAAKSTVNQSTDIEKDIRLLVVQALTEGKIEPESIKQTLQAVIKGACAGNSPQFNENTAALEQAILGLDGALEQVAEASKLSLEEAISNTQDFSDHDLKQAMQDLQDLESLFFNSLNEVANSGTGKAQEALTGLIAHLQNTGSTAGQTATKILTDLHQDLSKDGRLEKIQLADLAKASGITFARISSGILEGIADTLSKK